MYSTVIRFELQAPGHETLGGASHYYYTIITLHGLIMIFFSVMPILIGGFGNFIVPLQLGTYELSFSRISISSIFKNKEKRLVVYNMLLNFSFAIVLNYLLCESSTFLINQLGFMIIETFFLQALVYFLPVKLNSLKNLRNQFKHHFQKGSNNNRRLYRFVILIIFVF